MRTHGRAAQAVDELHCHFVFTANYHKPVLRGEIAVDAPFGLIACCSFSLGP